MDLIQRPRRLRGSENLRKMVRETRMDKSSLIYPLFVKEGTGIEEEIPSMEGQFRYSVDRLPFELERLQNAGVNSIMLFGIPDHKDEVGSGAYDPNGIVQKALREAKKQFPDMYYITDVCMCEYTSHGHCGVLCGHDVDVYKRQVKEWYDGYRFGNVDVYCPWDVINFCSDHLADPGLEPKNYWANTSGNSVISHFIDSVGKPQKLTRMELEQLVNGGLSLIHI